MSKQGKNDMPRYGRAERRAEAEIDTFLRGVSPPPTKALLDELKNLG